MADDKTISIYDDQVEKYANPVKTDKLGIILQTFINKIPKAGLVLDLGCGSGSASIQTHQQRL